MYRQRVLLLVSVLLLLVGAVSLYTGVVLWLMPRGGARSGWDWVTGSRGDLMDIHAWSGMVLVALTVIHVVLNWDWVANVVRRVLGQPGRLD